MTRIEPQLAAPTGDKPSEKAIGKVGSKDGDSRQAAFRSLMRQLGDHSKASEPTSGKDTKELAGNSIKHGAPTTRSRTASKDDKVVDAATEPAPTLTATEQKVGSEPVLALQSLLATGATDQPVQPMPVLDLSAAVSAQADDRDALAGKQGKAADAPADRFGRSMGPVLPNTPGLALAHGETSAPPTADPADPFSALSSLLNRAADTASEPETSDLVPIKMSVVTRETHFEPVARLSPVQQITTVVSQELFVIDEPAKTEAGPQQAGTSRHSSGPLKVLHLKLEPEDLGAVVLKMRLVDKSLELEVVASRQETADLLAKDRDALTRALRGSGYSADVVSITTSTSSDAGQTSGDARTGSNASSGQPGAQAGGNRGSNDSAGSDGRSPPRPLPAEGVTHEETGPGRSGGDLYL